MPDQIGPLVPEAGHSGPRPSAPQSPYCGLRRRSRPRRGPDERRLTSRPKTRSAIRPPGPANQGSTVLLGPSCKRPSSQTCGGCAAKQSNEIASSHWLPQSARDAPPFVNYNRDREPKKWGSDLCRAAILSRQGPFRVKAGSVPARTACLFHHQEQTSQGCTLRSGLLHRTKGY